jgi:hypothetical protein
MGHYAVFGDFDAASLGITLDLPFCGVVLFLFGKLFGKRMEILKQGVRQVERFPLRVELFGAFSPRTTASNFFTVSILHRFL